MKFHPNCIDYRDCYPDVEVPYPHQRKSTSIDKWEKESHLGSHETNFPGPRN